MVVPTILTISGTTISGLPGSVRSTCQRKRKIKILVKKFTWDGAGRFLDVTKLKIVLKRAEEAHQSAVDYSARLQDTINATKDIYFTISQHCCETETRLRIHGGHVRNLKQFISRSVFTNPLSHCTM